MSFVDDKKSVVQSTNGLVKVYEYYFDEHYELVPQSLAVWALRTNIEWDQIWYLPVGKVDMKGYDTEGRLVLFPTRRDAIRFVNGLRRRLNGAED